MNAIPTKYNLNFWVHLAMLLATWIAPFLFDWKWVLLAYSLVLLQFPVLGGCVMNKVHGLDDSGEDTFYAHLLEQLGFRFDRRKVKTFVRFWMFIMLGTITVVWQIVLGYEAPYL